MNPLNWLVNQVIKVGTSVLCRIDAPDLHKVPARGPLILYSNHSGSLEVPLLFAHLQPRPLTGWAKVETWDIPFYNWLFSLWGAIPVQRGEADISALKKALAALEQGCIFGLAPEGTRNHTGRLRRARPGAAALALHSAAPLLPVAHWGGEHFAANLKRLKRTDFHVRVGEPFWVDANGARPTRETRQAIVDEMMYRLAALLPPKYRGEYEDLEMATGRYLREAQT